MASVPAPAALWLLRWVNGSRPDGPDMLRAAEQFERNNQAKTGKALRFAYAQLQQSAALIQMDDLLPTVGNAEMDGSEIEAESGVASPLGNATLTTRQAAKELRLRSSRQVLNLVEKGLLLGDQPGGRGCVWEIDRQSVIDLRDIRRTA